MDKTASADGQRRCIGFKIVNKDYTPFYGNKEATVYHVGTRHRLPAGVTPRLCERGYHYCTVALSCLAFVPYVEDFDAEYRLLRVVDESLPGGREVSLDGHKTAASQLYIEAEITDAAERRRLLTGTTARIDGHVRRFVAGVLDNGADDGTDDSAAWTTYDSYTGAVWSRRWYRRGVLCRSGDAPSQVVYWPSSGRVKSRCWSRGGVNYRDGDRPAVVQYHECGALAGEWWYDSDGLRHRDGDLPSEIEYTVDGTRCNERWRWRDLLHRDIRRGPAVVERLQNGTVAYRAYYAHGRQIE